MTIAEVTYVIGRNFCRKDFLWRKVVLRKYTFLWVGFFHAITKINSQVVELLFKVFPTISGSISKNALKPKSFDHQLSAQGAGKQSPLKLDW